MAKIVDFPDLGDSLHPVAGMKRIHTLDGNERRFELSEAAKARQERRKSNAKAPKQVFKRAKVKFIRDEVIVRSSQGLKRLDIERYVNFSVTLQPIYPSKHVPREKP